MPRMITAICEACKSMASHWVCGKCGNIWHCNKKPGRSPYIAMNVCEKCGMSN